MAKHLSMQTKLKWVLTYLNSATPLELFVKQHDFKDKVLENPDINDEGYITLYQWTHRYLNWGIFGLSRVRWKEMDKKMKKTDAPTHEQKKLAFDKMADALSKDELKELLWIMQEHTTSQVDLEKLKKTYKGPR